ncbi:hypothetical protein BV22DRAFT_1056505 [Leucogyrophana mollusca]|uniref:Uncharacterized protein n=1 Tax=Leucogyrophana mollusca TaxID=85980 RepID=A0ACB8BVX3_9AGAM|nr:hypothetical protein BV22DRAFT_1056505 [Leucogyrophana mollusca]
MDTLPSKPPGSSKRGAGPLRRHRQRMKERAIKERERRSNGARESRSDSPKGSDSRPPEKRARVEGKGKAKENILDLEPGEVLAGPSKTFESNDDFIPFATESDDAASEPEELRREDRLRGKERAHEREWDRGKGRSRGDDRERDRDRDNSRGEKRKYDMVFDFDDKDDSSYRRQKPPSASRKAPWVSDVDWDSCHNVAEMLHQEVKAFVNYMSPTSVEDEIRSLIVDLVSKAVQTAFPDARVSPFGSYATKLYLPSGDIDLVIDSDSMAYSNKVTVLHALANTIKRARITTKVTIIAKAKVPIIKFVTSFGRLNVDISVNQGNGIVAGKIVNGFLKDMRGCGFALRSLVIIAKAFLNQRGMNEVYTGGLGSYSIVCLAVSFLQMHPKIRRGEIDAEKNLGVLVMEFFELYGCYFNYEEVGISVRNGGTYFSKRQRGWYDSFKRNLLSIEDPTDPSNDISKGSYGIGKVRQTLAGAHGIMTTTAFLRAGMLSSRRDGRSYPLRRHNDPEDLSILSSILGVTQETINNRLLLQEVYDQRSLHRLLGVVPKAAVVPAIVPIDENKNENTHSQSTRGATIIENAWSEADMELESGEERHTNGVHRDEQEGEETGRYHIEERRPSKRRKEGSWKDEHPMVFTTDDEDDEPHEYSEDEAEYQAYDIRDKLLEDDESDSSERKSRMSRRRSYWLSKGIGPGLDGDIDDESS